MLQTSPRTGRDTAPKRARPLETPLFAKGLGVPVSLGPAEQKPVALNSAPLRGNSSPLRVTAPLYTAQRLPSPKATTACAPQNAVPSTSQAFNPTPATTPSASLQNGQTSSGGSFGPAPSGGSFTLPVAPKGDVLTAIKALDHFLNQTATVPSAPPHVQRQVSTGGSFFRSTSPRPGSLTPLRQISSPVHIIRQSSVTRQNSVQRQISSTSPPRNNSRSATPLGRARSPPPVRVDVPTIVPPMSKAIGAPAETGPPASTAAPVMMPSMLSVLPSSSFPKMEPSKFPVRSASPTPLDLQPRPHSFGGVAPPLAAMQTGPWVAPNASMPVMGYPVGLPMPCYVNPAKASGGVSQCPNSPVLSTPGKGGGSTPPRFRMPTRGSFQEVVFSTPEGKHYGAQQLAGGSRPLGPMQENQRFVGAPSSILVESPDQFSSPKPPVPNPSPIPEW